MNINEMPELITEDAVKWVLDQEGMMERFLINLSRARLIRRVSDEKWVGVGVGSWFQQRGGRPRVMEAAGLSGCDLNLTMGENWRRFLGRGGSVSKSTFRRRFNEWKKNQASGPLR